MLIKLGLNNVKHNFKNYISYFISTVVSVFILMIFYSIYYTAEIQSFSSSRVKVGVIFKAASFIVILFSAIFISYANSFFIKRKKKELAIYSLVGMKKKEIAVLMFFENIFLGMIALVTAVPLGVFTAGYFLKILTLFMNSAVSIEYTFDIRSLLMTCAVFILIFLLNSIKAYKIIYKFKLIELIHASKEGEKKPKFSKALAIISLIMITIGYVGALLIDAESGGMKMVYEGIVVILFVVAGTYLLFNNLIVYILTTRKKNKKSYYNRENLLSISQIIYRIKGNSNLLATIAVLSAVAITALCFTFSFGMVLEKVEPNGSPFSVMFEGSDNELNEKADAVISDHDEVNVTYKNDFIMINGYGLTDNYKGPFRRDLKAPFDMYIMSKSEYMDIIDNSGFNKGSDIASRPVNIEINDDSQCFFIEVTNLSEGRRRLQGDKLNASIGGKDYEFTISDSDVKCVLGINFQKTAIVVSDSCFNKLLENNKDNITVIRTYNFDKLLESENLCNELSKIMPQDKCFTSYCEMYVSGHTLYGSYVFIGLFIGILFVMSTGSIMYYKQLTEAYEDKERYAILYKIGLTKKEILKIVIKQLSFIFAMPILFALMHSIAALAGYINYCGWSVSQVEWVSTVLVGYLIIYFCFYVLSVFSYMKVISSKPSYVSSN